jgi:uncharacterized protein YcgI (DUF1989 family)
VFSTYLLSLGMRLVTNRRRPMMVLGKDTVGMHDLLLPASTTAYLNARGYRARRDRRCRRRGLQAKSGLQLPDPINLFLHTGCIRTAG